MLFCHWKSYLARLYCHCTSTYDHLYTLLSLWIVGQDSGSSCSFVHRWRLFWRFIYFFFLASWDHTPETGPNLSIDFLYKSISAGWYVWGHAPVSSFPSSLFLHAPLCSVPLINGLSRRKNWRIIQRKKTVLFDGSFETQAAHKWSNLEGRKCHNPLQSLFNVMWQKTTSSPWWLFKSNRLHEEGFFFFLVRGVNPTATGAAPCLAAHFGGKVGFDAPAPFTASLLGFPLKLDVRWKLSPLTASALEAWDWGVCRITQRRHCICSHH